jgi:RNA polymerase sigma-70 factor (ECF subfamily)
VIDREQHLRKLMLRALDGDIASARSLLTEVREHLVDYYRRRLPRQESAAEDLAQECLLAIHAKRSTYDRRLPFSAWAYAIARYKLIDHLRRCGRECTVPIDAVHVPASAGPQDALMRGELARILSTLPESHRALIEDVRIEGYSFAEAAERHGLSESAAKVRVHRSLKALSKWVSADEA